MPILNDIMDSEVLGPLIRQGRAEGRVEGRAEGQLELLLELTERRFGAAAQRYRGRLAAMNPAELRAAGLRLLDAARIEDLFA